MTTSDIDAASDMARDKTLKIGNADVPAEASDHADAVRLSAGRAPEWVVVLWVSEQLRPRLRGTGVSLADALAIGHKDTMPWKHARSGEGSAA
jgi:hypothetical protein